MSESVGGNVDTDRMWRREGNIAKIAQCCELFFEWGYEVLVIKRFRTFLWGGVCTRVPRRGVMDSDEKEVAAHRPDRNYRSENGGDTMATPRKTGRRAHEFAVGTSTGLIRHYSQDMQHAPPSQLGCEFRDEYGGEGKELFDSDNSLKGTPFYGWAVGVQGRSVPCPSVRLAESGIRGLRSPLRDNLGPDTGEDEDEAGDEGDWSRKRKAKKPPPHPEEPMLLWLPAVLLEMAVPAIVEEFEGVEGAKARKKQETEQRKKDRVEGKIVLRQAKAEKGDAKTEGQYHTIPTQRNTSIASKRKDGQLRRRRPQREGTTETETETERTSSL